MKFYYCLVGQVVVIFFMCLHENIYLGKIYLQAPDKSTEQESESLPEGWNSSPSFYAIRYSSKNEKDAVYILKVIQIEDDFLVHFMVLY